MNLENRSSPLHLAKTFYTFILILTALLCSGLGQSALAQQSNDVTLIRNIETGLLGFPSPAGLGYSDNAQTFFVLETPPNPLPAISNLIVIDEVGGLTGTVPIAVGVEDPINMTFDNNAERLFIYQPGSISFIEFTTDSFGILQPGTLTSIDASSFGLVAPRGMTVDPATGVLFILDSVGPRIVRIEPDPVQGFSQPSVSAISLAGNALGELQGIALNPATGNFHILDPPGGLLFEMTDAGQPVQSRDVSGLGLLEPHAMVFAPTGDQTDDPSLLNLYIADSGNLSIEGNIVELRLSALASLSGSSSVNVGTDGNGAALQVAQIIDVRVSTGSDDAEESASGSVGLTSSDLELVQEGSTQTVGMRFNGVAIPPGATITNAYVQFQVDESTGGVANLFVQGEKTPNPVTFTSSASNITNRTPTTATVPWSPADWPTVGAAGVDQRTSDITTVIQEIVNQGGWADGNSLVILITGSGKRTAESFNGDPSGAALLHVEFDTGPPVQVEVPDVVGLAQGAAEGLITGANLVPNTTLASSVSVAAGNVISQNPVNPTLVNEGSVVDIVVSTGPPPVQVVVPDVVGLEQTAAEGLITGAGLVPNVIFASSGSVAAGNVVSQNPENPTSVDTGSVVDIVVSTGPAPAVTVVDVRVAASSDDAEESGGGSVGLTSSDLELVNGGSLQTVGMRFNNILIPSGATITKAYVQFQVDEVETVSTSLTVKGEKSANAVTFTGASNEISSRPTTTASVLWSPPPWNTVGEAGPDQQTPDIKSVIQEIVSQGGWVNGNSLVIIITGAGKRTAESYDGVPSGAPLLHVEFSTGPDNDPPSTPTGLIATAASSSQISLTWNPSTDNVGVAEYDVFRCQGTTCDPNTLVGSSPTPSFADTGLPASTNFSYTVLARDGSGNTSGESSPATARTLDPGQFSFFTFVGGGDIAQDGQLPGAEATAALIDAIVAEDPATTVFTTGDNVSPDGTAAEFNTLYDPTWGRHRLRTFPTPGNHDYDGSSPANYLDYFCPSAGDCSFPGGTQELFYSYNLGNWHIIALDSTEGFEAGSPQVEWLKQDLAANTRTCIIGYFHHPFYSSGQGANDRSTEFWRELIAAKADIVINGHDHFYERFEKQDLNGNVDPEGIRQFTIGNAGYALSSPNAIDPNSIVRYKETRSILKFTLKENSYDWEVVSEPGATFTDTGSDTCNNTGSISVPDVVGETEAVATTAIEGPGLVVGAVTSENSLTVPVGNVISQTPPAGALVAPGSAVNLVVSLGPVVVPDVVGQSQSTAETNIVVAGLIVGNVTTSNSPSVPAGDVISQNPLANVQVAPGSAVDIVISLGPVPVQVEVPDVVGLAQAAAEGLITGAGLVPNVTTASSQSVAAGNVISQNPVNPTLVDVGSVVDIVVSTGPPPTVPNVVGDDETTAQGKITGAGLVVGSVTTDSSASVPAGDVISQNPPAGTVVALGSPVDIVVSTGPPPVQVAVPDVVGQAQALAEGLITGATLIPNTTFASSDTVPAGDVISQNPPATTLVDTGSAVDITVSTGPPPASTTLDVRVEASSDDAEESSSGSVGLTSSDLEMTQEGSQQTIGIRFNGVAIPPGATITSAYVQFQVDESTSGAVSLTVNGEKTANAVTFTGSANNITNRTPTTATVPWFPADWPTVGAAGVDQRTSDISAVIQEIVDQGLWASGNSLVIIITGTGKRTAESFNGNPAGAALLHVEFSTAPPVQVAVPDVVGKTQAVAVADILAAGLVTGNITPQSSPTVPSGEVIDQTPVATTQVNVGSSVDIVVSSGPPPVQVAVPNVVGSTQTVAEADIVNATLVVGTITPQSSATIPAGEVISQNPPATTLVDTGSAVDITVSTGPAPAVTTLDIRVSASSDDAEEFQGGAVSLGSSDLEMVNDGGDQTVGMRFNNLAIPAGSTITNAYVQFQVDEVPSEPTTLTVRGEKSANPGAFIGTLNNITSRTPTTASVPWVPAGWPTIGAAGLDQRTPDLTAVIQEIVDQGLWASGNSLVIVVTGTGERVAESFNGDPAGAPVLHVEFSIAPPP